MAPVASSLAGVAAADADAHAVAMTGQFFLGFAAQRASALPIASSAAQIL
jgi:hypothetical protein